MKWNATERALVKVLAQHRPLFPGGMTYGTLATVLQCSHRTLQRAVKRLELARLVKRCSPSARAQQLVKLAKRSASPVTGLESSPASGNAATVRRASSSGGATSRRRSPLKKS